MFEKRGTKCVLPVVCEVLGHPKRWVNRRGVWEGSFGTPSEDPDMGFMLLVAETATMDFLVPHSSPKSRAEATPG